MASKAVRVPAKPDKFGSQIPFAEPYWYQVSRHTPATTDSFTDSFIDRLIDRDCRRRITRRIIRNFVPNVALLWRKKLCHTLRNGSKRFVFRSTLFTFDQSNVDV